jgi:uncharacterized protein YcgI (DUF1989 family)
MSSTEAVAVHQGEAACLALVAGDTLRIEQLAGGQCVDLLAWGDREGRERFSAAITRSREGGSPSVGASLWSAWPDERPLLEITADTAPGHDLLHPACTPGEYERLGVLGEPSCASVHATAAATWGFQPEQLPDPFNLWFRSTLSVSDEIGWLPTKTAAGDHLELGALVDCVVVANPCVDDVFGCSTIPGGSVRVTRRSAAPSSGPIRIVGERVATEMIDVELGDRASSILGAMAGDLDRVRAVLRGALRHALRVVGPPSAERRSAGA